MSKPDLLTCLESALRESVAAESFAEAGLLLKWYTLAVGHQLHGLEPGSPAVLTLQARVNGAFEWANVRTNAFRACAVTEAARLRFVALYDREPASPHIAASA